MQYGEEPGRGYPTLELLRCPFITRQLLALLLWKQFS